MFSQSACDPIVVCELRRGFDVSYVGAAHSLPTLPTGITKTRARPRRDAVRTGLPATSSRWAATHGADHGPGESKTTHLGFGLRNRIVKATSHVEVKVAKCFEELKQDGLVGAFLVQPKFTESRQLE